MKGKINKMRTTQTTMSVAFIIISLVAGSFAQEAEIKTDYDRTADFSHYKSFSFEKVETEDPLWVGRITAAIGHELTAKGWTRVASGGDIAVIAIRITTDGQTLDHFYDTYNGGWGWRWGSGYPEAPTTPETYTVGTLVIDLFDRKTKALLWRGSARRVLSDSSTTTIKNFNKSVEKLFKEFPSKT